MSDSTILHGLIVLCVLLWLCSPPWALAIPSQSDAIPSFNFSFFNRPDLTNRSSLYGAVDHSNWPERERIRLLGYRNLSLRAGFLSEFSSIAEAITHYRNIRISYYCRFSIEDHLNVYLNIDDAHDSSTGRFNATQFLTMMRNKKLSFYGDSLNRQMALDLAAELAAHETDYLYGEDHRFINASQKPVKSYSGKYNSMRIYSAFNVTIVVSEDGQGTRLLDARKRSKWDAEVLSSDIIVLGVGVWWKPLHTPVFYPDNYYKDMEAKLPAYNQTLHALRGVLSSLAPQASVIWRLNAHAGLMDEIPSLRNITNNTGAYDPKIFFHKHGMVWSDPALGALWPMLYNQQLIDVAKQYRHDLILDLWQVSMVYLRHFVSTPERTEVMADSLHACPGTIPRGGIFLLYHLLWHRRKDMALTISK